MRIIDPSEARNLAAHFRELIAHRELLASWVGRELKVRYKQSLLGAAWAIVQPLSATVIFAVVFSRFVQVPTAGMPYLLFYYAALVPWTFFSSALTLAVPTLVSNMSLVTKTYFPREILPLASVIASLVDLGAASLLFLALLLIYRRPFTASILYAPLIIALETLLATGLVLYASAVNVFYRDVRFVIPLIIQVWMYVSPVIYPLSVVPPRFRPFYMLNPMASLIESFRNATVAGQPPDLRYLALAGAVSFSVFVVAFRFFKKQEMRFADVI